jgi:predicted Na+-dependent transporter
VQNNQFGFNITGTNSFSVVVAACTNLASPVWVPLTTNTLIAGSFHFSDPQWTNYPSRFYSLQMP